MLSFDELPRSVQLRRMRRLAQTALAAYAIDEAQITSIQHFLNTTFRVDVPVKKERYALRISSAGYQDVAAIQSELHWLRAIRRDTELVVPEPVLARDGSLCVTITVPGVPGARHCVVFRWIDGRFHNTSLRPVELELVGNFMARLHLHAQSLDLPASFHRKRWDVEGLQGNSLGIDVALARKHLSREQQRTIDAVAARVQQMMHLLGEGSAVFGLIHADLHEGNYLFHNGELRVIDFDTSGWGHYLYDIAVTFSTLLNRPGLPAYRKAFLRGYRQVRELPVEYEQYIDKFIAARVMGHSLWIAAHIGKPAFGAKAVMRVARQLEWLRNTLEDGQI